MPGTTTPEPKPNLLEQPPPQCLHHVGALYELGRIGHVRGIEAKLREGMNALLLSSSDASKTTHFCVIPVSLRVVSRSPF